MMVFSAQLAEGGGGGRCPHPFTYLPPPLELRCPAPPNPPSQQDKQDVATCSVILEKYMRARNREGTELSHRPVSLRSLAGLIPTRFLAPRDCYDILSLYSNPLPCLLDTPVMRIGSPWSMLIRVQRFWFFLKKMKGVHRFIGVKSNSKTLL